MCRKSIGGSKKKNAKCTFSSFLSYFFSKKNCIRNYFLTYTFKRYRFISSAVEFFEHIVCYCWTHLYFNLIDQIHCFPSLGQLPNNSFFPPHDILIVFLLCTQLCTFFLSLSFSLDGMMSFVQAHAVATICSVVTNSNANYYTLEGSKTTTKKKKKFAAK